MTAATMDTRAAGPSTGRDRQRLVAAALVLGAVTVAGLFLWRPGTARDALDYADIAPVRDATWLTGVFDAVGSGLAYTAFALGVCMLVNGRGRTLATIGAAFTIFGHILLSAGVFAAGVLFWYTTDPDALSEEAGTGMLDYFQDHLGHVIGPQFVGFSTASIGVLVMAAALWRSRVVPRWYPPVLVAGLVLIGAGGGRLLDVLEAVDPDPRDPRLVPLVPRHLRQPRAKPARRVRPTGENLGVNRRHEAEFSALKPIAQWTPTAGGWPFGFSPGRGSHAERFARPERTPLGGRSCSETGS